MVVRRSGFFAVAIVVLLAGSAAARAVNYTYPPPAKYVLGTWSLKVQQLQTSGSAPGPVVDRGARRFRISRYVPRADGTDAISGRGPRSAFTVRGYLVGAGMKMHWIFPDGYTAEFDGTSFLGYDEVGGVFSDSLGNTGSWVARRLSKAARHKPAPSLCPAVRPRRGSPRTPSLTLCIDNVRGEYFASGSGWRSGERVSIYLDTAEGARYVGTAKAKHHGGFGPVKITDFLPAIMQPGDEQFASSEVYPVVAMDSKGDGATIEKLTEAKVARETRLRLSSGSLSSGSATVNGGCSNRGDGLAGSTSHRAALLRLKPGTGLGTSGASMTYDGRPVRLASVNWYGAEEADFVPGGLQCVKLRNVAAEIRKLGFNSVRLPWSNAMFELDPEICSSTQLGTLAPCIPPQVLAANGGLRRPRESARQIFIDTVDALTKAGLMVILDNHGTDAAFEPVKVGGENLDGLWWGGQYWDNEYGFGADPQARTNCWVIDWEHVVQMFESNPNVIGADLRNEPSETPYSCGGGNCNPAWGSADAAENWLGAATQAGDAILNTNPRLLIFVEGTGYATDLSSVAGSRLKLSQEGHVVYSAHYYPGDSPTWEYIHDEGIAPLWIGEFGDTVTSKCPGSEPRRTRTWLRSFSEYLRQNSSSWWAINGMMSDGGIFHAGRTYYDRETYGLLCTSWNSVASASLIRELRHLQR
jgi:endoglucanase